MSKQRQGSALWIIRLPRVLAVVSRTGGFLGATRVLNCSEAATDVPL